MPTEKFHKTLFEPNFEGTTEAKSPLIEKMMWRMAVSQLIFYVRVKGEKKGW